MLTKKKVALCLMFLFFLFLLTSCADEQSLDAKWLERAHANINTSEVEGYFKWVILLAIPCFIFAAISLLTDDWVGFFSWSIILVFFVGSFLLITDVLQTIIAAFWPDSFSISTIMDWFGWQLPWPKDAVWTSFYAYGFSDLIPSVYNMWQWILLTVHAGTLLAIGFSRNIRPIWADMAFIATWAISPMITAGIAHSAAANKAAASTVLSKSAIEVGYILVTSGVAIALCVLLPLGILVLTFISPITKGKLQSQWGPNWWENKDRSESIKRMFDKFSFEEAAALIAGLFTELPQPHRNGINGSSTAEFPKQSPPSGDYPHGSDQDLGLSSPPSTGPTGPLVSRGERDRSSDRNGVKTTETSTGQFKPISKRIKRDDGLSDLKNKGEFSPRVHDLGRAAKTVAPLAASVKPEAGLIIGAAGEILDRTNQTKEEGEFASPVRREKRSDESTTEITNTRPQGGGEFSPLSRSSGKRSADLTSDEGDDDAFPQIKRRDK